MASFGSFTTVREVYSDPTYSVYGAQKAGDPKTDYAIKLFSVQHSEFDTESGLALDPLIRDLEGSFSNRIAIQQQAAAQSAHIAPVFEIGSDERGVWYATRFYARSVNRIISGRVALNQDALHHIIRCVARGALDLKRICGRSHGEIRPSNVQISLSQKLNEAEVVLCDPLPGGPEEDARYEAADLRAIGMILLQLVRQREMDADRDALILPILVSEEWKRLFGKDTDRWLALCNRLLDPNLSIDQLSLEQLVAELDALAPKAGGSPKLLIAVAAGVALLLGGGFAVWQFVLKRPAGQVVAFTSDPPGATILVDGTALEGATRDGMQATLPLGAHVIEARHDKLRLREQTTNVTLAGGAPLKLHFQFAYGSLALRTEPGGVAVLRDGVELGRTPATGPLVLSNVAGGVEVQYEFAGDGYVTQKIPFTVKTGERRNETVTLPRIGTTGQLELDSTPRGAEISLNGKVILKATPDVVELVQGPHVLVATYRDWGSLTQTVDVVKDAKKEVNFPFPYANVTFESDPPGATVWSETNLVATAGSGQSVLRPAGQATFRFERVGFEETNVTVALVDKSRPTVKAALATTNGTFILSANVFPTIIRDPDGKEHTITSAAKPLVLVYPPPGPYAFLARTEGLSDVAVQLAIQKREQKTNVFAFDFGTIEFTSDVPGATVAPAAGGAARPLPATFTQRPGTKGTYRLTAPDHLPVTQEVTLASRDARTLPIKLLREPVAVTLTSDPPGAQFLMEGKPLTGAGPFQLPWGQHTVVARHAAYPWLADVTGTFEARKGAANAQAFKFEYSAVVFETVPSDVVADVFEGDKRVASSPSTHYARPGPVEYRVIYENQTNRVKTNLLARTSVTIPSTFEVKRDYTNSVGMILARGKDGYYAGKFEVTEGHYAAVMGEAATASLQTPKVFASFAKAQAFCQKLTEMDQATLTRQKLVRWTYALPTEKEWTSLASTEYEQVVGGVFFVPGADNKPLEVDPSRKSANKAGFYDMFGNVAEWGYGPDGRPVALGGAYNNPTPKQVGFPNNVRVLRPPGDLKDDAINNGSRNIGFRCVLKPPGP